MKKNLDALDHLGWGNALNLLENLRTLGVGPILALANATMNSESPDDETHLCAMLLEKVRKLDSTMVRLIDEAGSAQKRARERPHVI